MFLLRPEVDGFVGSVDQGHGGGDDERSLECDSEALNLIAVTVDG